MSLVLLPFDLILHNDIRLAIEAIEETCLSLTERSDEPMYTAIVAALSHVLANALADEEDPDAAVDTVCRTLSLLVTLIVKDRAPA